MTDSGEQEKSRAELLEQLETLRHENARLESDKAVDHLYREAPIGLCFVNTDLRYVQINDWLAKVNGLPASEHLGRTITDILPHAASELELQFRHVIQSGEPILKGRVRIETPAHPGVKRIYEHNYFPQRSSDGTIVGVSCVVDDVTDSCQVEDSLRRSNQLLEATAGIGKLATSSLELPRVLDAILGGTMTAVGAAAGVIFLVDADTGLLTVAATAGVSEESEVDLRRSLATGGSRAGLVGHIVQTGEPMYIRQGAGQDSRAFSQDMHSFIGVPIHSNDQLITAMSLSTRQGAVFEEWDLDLATAVASQVGLVVRNARLVTEQVSLSAAIEQSSEVITITDVDGVMRYVNPAFEIVTGYSREEAIGEKPSILASGKHGPEHFRNLWKTITNGEVWVGRFVNRRKDGAIWEAESTITPMRNREGKIEGFVEVKRDVSELQKRLLQAQKMEALGRLAGGVAHDFNNLLTVIQGNADLLMADTDESGSMHQGLGIIKRAVRRATDLTQRLLVFSKERPVNPATLRIDDAVRGVEPMLRRLISEDVDLYVMLDSAPWIVDIDPVQLEQVIINLVVNACDAMPSGGQLILTTNRRSDADGTGKGSDGSTEGVELAVRDSGIGMDADTMDRILDPFFTTKDDGTGLGLSIVNGIVTQTGGELSIDSEPGTGTSFKVFWPRSVAGTPESPSPETGTEVEHGTETVLVVDDDPGVRDFMVKVLARYGYSVLEERTAQEAIETFESRPEEIRLVVTDVLLPGTSGPDLAERLKELQPELPILFVTGYMGRHIDHPALAEAEVLRKPFEGGLLARAVRKALDAAVDTSAPN